MSSFFFELGLFFAGGLFLCGCIHLGVWLEARNFSRRDRR